jgi:hypothetical protein
MGKICPKHVELTLEINKTVIVASSWSSIFLQSLWKNITPWDINSDPASHSEVSASGSLCNSQFHYCFHRTSSPILLPLLSHRKSMEFQHPCKLLQSAIFHSEGFLDPTNPQAGGSCPMLIQYISNFHLWSKAVFFNRRAAVGYRSLTSITPGRERPDETTICYKISLVQRLITNLNVILYLSTCHTVYMCTNILYDYVIINY